VESFWWDERLEPDVRDIRLRLTYLPKLSTDNWPGKRALVFSFQGCDLRCPWCNAVETIDPKGGKTTGVRRVIEYLRHIGRTAEAILLTGGEPLYQSRACLALIVGAKSLGFECGIETNGTNTEDLREILPLLDFVAIDVKAPLTEPILYGRVIGRLASVELVQKITESFRMAVSMGIEVEARTTVIPGLTDSERVIREIAIDLRGVDRWRLQQFMNKQTFDPKFKRTPMPTRRRLLDLARVARHEGIPEVYIQTTTRGLEKLER
jgi:pyruvate formate lyase activating enzyme